MFPENKNEVDADIVKQAETYDPNALRKMVASTFPLRDLEAWHRAFSSF